MKRQLHAQQQMLDAGESPDTVLQKHVVSNIQNFIVTNIYINKVM